jgi:hypothetical protein
VTSADKARAVAAAAAHDLNDELTIVLGCLNAAFISLPRDAPERLVLAEAQDAARRCAWKAAGLLRFGARAGRRPSAATMEQVLSTI